jgi:hypothetical protein
MKTITALLVIAFSLSNFIACTPSGATRMIQTPSIQEQDAKAPSQNGENNTLTKMICGEMPGSGSTFLTNTITGNFGFVGGGHGNSAGEGSTIGGGAYNSALYFYATIGGGRENNASGPEATIGGGHHNISSGRRSTIGGGAANTASDLDTTIRGGSGNLASYRFSTIGGGTENIASGLDSLVSGGAHNRASGAFSSVTGGVNNQASEFGSTVNGGAGNMASGIYAVVPGGFANQAGGDYSLAAGRGARVLWEHPGTFLFADSTKRVFFSEAKNEFAVRSTGGARFVTGIDNDGNTTAGVQLLPGSNGWESLSDRNSTKGITPEERRLILDQLMNVPIRTWSYGDPGTPVRHMGPTGQEFFTAFSLGKDNGYTSTGDVDGVALASIQGLYEIIQQQNLELANLRMEKASKE